MFETRDDTRRSERQAGVATWPSAPERLPGSVLPLVPAAPSPVRSPRRCPSNGAGTGRASTSFTRTQSSDGAAPSRAAPSLAGPDPRLLLAPLARESRSSRFKSELFFGKSNGSRSSRLTRSRGPGPTPAVFGVSLSRRPPGCHGFSQKSRSGDPGRGVAERGKIRRRARPEGPGIMHV